MVEESEYISLRSDGRAGDKHRSVEDRARGDGRLVAMVGRRATILSAPSNGRRRSQGKARVGRLQQSSSDSAQRPSAAGCRARAEAGPAPSSARSTTASACWPARCRDEGRGLHPSPSPAPNPLARSLVACVGMWAYLITHPLAQGAGSLMLLKAIRTL